MNFVDSVFFLRDSLDINKFRLAISESMDFSRIDAWICIAVMRNVVELDLDLSDESGRVLDFEMPQSLFKSKTLTILRVSSNIISYYPPTSGCFPSLQFLHISADNPYKESIEKLFSCCPVLEYLSIHLSVGPGFIHKINISAPQLKTLQISLDEDNENKNYFYINAPQLDNLNLKGRDLSNYFLQNAISGINASFAFKYLSRNQLFSFPERALAGISRVKYLSLSAYSLDAQYLPVLVNLTKLKLVLHECKCWELLAELLLRAPNLEDLALEDVSKIGIRLFYAPPTCSSS
ncbi:F-box/LRR-repeat protein [Pyrus ussuriensis x Pyrus communis]|uniref:F-box/LRR-repeat protein n=2 Tax=Pyrus TaxID=3766 RepID=A0A5N5GH27_9ROSA|nr:F-box/LRR-repeat protein [Pyrus ussuriensis x Pyrus communis]